MLLLFYCYKKVFVLLDLLSFKTITKMASNVDNDDLAIKSEPDSETSDDDDSVDEMEKEREFDLWMKDSVKQGNLPENQ